MIEVADLRVSLGETSVLSGVSLSVDRGAFVGLVGPNGAGKTTLLRAINGALDPDGGRVVVDGERIPDLPSRAASRLVATVPQDTGARFAFTVEDVVAMGRTPHRSRLSGDPDGREHVDRALERTDTAVLRDRRLTEISGGERRRVYVARALAQDAPALVLDEPTASLDVNHAARTLGLARDLADDGRAVLAAIHDLEAAARYCDRLVLLSDGAVLARGTPDAVLDAEGVRSAFGVRGVVTDHSVTGSPTVTALPEVAPAAGEGGRRVHVLGAGRPAARAVADCFAAGHAVTAGPLAAGDVALSVARDLGVSAVGVPPLSAPGADARSEAAEWIAAADVTVLAGPEPPDPLRKLARGADRLVVVGDGNTGTEDAGSDGVDEKGQRRVTGRAETVRPGEVVEAVAAGSPPAAADD